MQRRVYSRTLAHAFRLTIAVPRLAAVRDGQTDVIQA